MKAKITYFRNNLVTQQLEFRRQNPGFDSRYTVLLRGFINVSLVPLKRTLNQIAGSQYKKGAVVTNL